MTHMEKLLDWFASQSTITPEQAVSELRNFRLADTVFNLREEGHEIVTEMVERKRQDGRTVRWARYHYVAAPSKVAA